MPKPPNADEYPKLRCHATVWVAETGFPCWLSDAHDGPHMAVESAPSREARAKWEAEQSAPTNDLTQDGGDAKAGEVYDEDGFPLVEGEEGAYFPRIKPHPDRAWRMTGGKWVLVERFQGNRWREAHSKKLVKGPRTYEGA